MNQSKVSLTRAVFISESLTHTQSVTQQLLVGSQQPPLPERQNIPYDDVHAFIFYAIQLMSHPDQPT